MACVRRARRRETQAPPTAWIREGQGQRIVLGRLRPPRAHAVRPYKRYPRRTRCVAPSPSRATVARTISSFVSARMAWLATSPPGSAASTRRRTRWPRRDAAAPPAAWCTGCASTPPRPRATSPAPGTAAASPMCTRTATPGSPPGCCARARDFLATLQDPRSGGLRTRVDREGPEVRQEVMSSAMAGIAALIGGRLEIADGVARFLRTILAAQPRPAEMLCHVYTPADGVITQFPEQRAGEFAVIA